MSLPSDCFEHEDIKALDTEKKVIRGCLRSPWAEKLGRKESYPLHEYLHAAEGARSSKLPPSFLPASVPQEICMEIPSVL